MFEGLGRVAALEIWGCALLNLKDFGKVLTVDPSDTQHTVKSPKPYWPKP